MIFTSVEREFLRRLAKEAWTSPPLFDHDLVVRLVETGLVVTSPLTTGEVCYSITEAGREALANALKN